MKSVDHDRQLGGKLRERALAARQELDHPSAAVHAVVDVRRLAHPRERHVSGRQRLVGPRNPRLGRDGIGAAGIPAIPGLGTPVIAGIGGTPGGILPAIG